MTFSAWVLERPVTLLIVVFLTIGATVVVWGGYLLREGRRLEQRVDRETMDLLRAQRAARVEANFEIDESNLYI